MRQKRRPFTANDTIQTVKVRFPFGLKLVLIVTLILLVSLGLITFLVSFMVSQDMRLTAEETNFSINKQMSATAQTILSMMRSSSKVVLASALEEQRMTSYFFEQNPDIAALALISPGGNPPFILSNQRFFTSYGIPFDLLEQLCAQEARTFEEAALGYTILLNVSPRAGTPLLAFIFPWTEAGRQEAAVVLFSASLLAETFGSGTSANTNILVNAKGDILIHPNPDIQFAGSNMAGDPLFAMARSSGAVFRQTRYIIDGTYYLGAFSRIPAGLYVITTIEEDHIFEGLAATTRRNMYLTGAVLLFAILLIWFYSKTVSSPVRILAAAAEQIEQGFFEFDLRPKTKDEIGLLTASFSRMSKALGIFGRFTNREIAVRAMRGEIAPGGFPKYATVFFSDIRGFTAKSEAFTKVYGEEEASNRIVQWLNEYLTRMVECVEKTGGVVDKFIGDAVMAHWGTAYTAGSPEKDALACLKAALLMRAAVYELNKSRKDGDAANPPIQIGCGINSGIVTAGQIGSDQRMEYTVIGDVVNIASRVESLNKPLGTDILISENTWNLVSKHLITEEMPPVSVKGKEKPLRIFAVVGPLSSSDEQKGLRTIADVRRLLRISGPEGKVTINVEEKYKFKED